MKRVFFFLAIAFLFSIQLLAQSDYILDGVSSAPVLLDEQAKMEREGYKMTEDVEMGTCILFNLNRVPFKKREVDAPTAKKKKVFLFAGQSNMEGRADGANLSAEDLQRLEKVAKNIEFHYNHQSPVSLQLTTPRPHIKKKFSLETCFGPELFFGINMAEQYPDDEFIFIKRSQGGTSLYGCWNPYWEVEKAAQMNEAEKPKLFSDFVDYTKRVLAQYDISEYEICGMLWVQGEADSGVKKWGPEPAEAYGENLRKLIMEVRREFETPDLPFVMFQVGGGKVVEGMRETAAQDPLVFLIPQSSDQSSPDFFPKNPPPVGHYTTEGMKKLGYRFFEAFSDILPTQ